MHIQVWNPETYQEYLNYLISLANTKYKEFQSSLCQTKYSMLGIKLPLLRNIAKREFISFEREKMRKPL